MNHDLNTYLDAARKQCEANRAKWGKQSAEVLYCVLAEEWGEFVRAINHWRWNRKGATIADIEREAVDALAVMVDMDFIDEDTAVYGPAEMAAQKPLVKFDWHHQIKVGASQLSTSHRLIHLRATIMLMLTKALSEEASR